MGFVSDHQIVCAGAIDVFHSGFELAFEDFFELAGIAFFKRLSDAEDGLDAGFESGGNFALNVIIGLTEDGATFAVTENHIDAVELLDHASTDLASEGTGRLRRHVLSGDGNIL